MNYVYAKISKELNFYGNTSPFALTEKYGSPLYVYNEPILRSRCKEFTGLIDYPGYVVNYSPKANSNIELLKIIKDEGLSVDAVSAGEIYTDLKAGYSADRISYVCNNVSAEELLYAVKTGVNISKFCAKLF